LEDSVKGRSDGEVRACRSTEELEVGGPTMSSSSPYRSVNGEVSSLVDVGRERTAVLQPDLLQQELRCVEQLKIYHLGTFLPSD